MRLSVSAAAGVALTFEAQPERAYVLEFTDSLPAGLWTPLATVPAQALVHTEILLDAVPPATRFYRLRLTAWPGIAP